MCFIWPGDIRFFVINKHKGRCKKKLTKYRTKMFSRKNLPLYFYVLFAMVSIHRSYAFSEQRKRRSTANDAEITKVSLLELPEAGELYEMVPRVVSDEESLTTSNGPESSRIFSPVYIHGIPFIIKDKFYYQHKRWLPKTYIKGNFYKMRFNNAKCKFIIIKQY